MTSNGGKRSGVLWPPPPPHRRAWGTERTQGAPRTEPLSFKPSEEFQRWMGSGWEPPALQIGPSPPRRQRPFKALGPFPGPPRSPGKGPWQVSAGGAGTGAGHSGLFPWAVERPGEGDWRGRWGEQGGARPGGGRWPSVGAGSLGRPSEKPMAGSRIPVPSSVPDPHQIIPQA